MKKTYQFAILFVTIICFLASCHTKDKSIRTFIPGTYARFAEGEYSKSWDTLRISLYDAKGNTYVVQRRTGFHRIKDGKIQPKEYESERWITVYDPSTGQMQELKSGKLFVFSPEMKNVLVGSAEYKKVE